MALRFVSGGVIAGDGDESAGEAEARAGETRAGEIRAGAKNSAEWEAVQRDLETERRAREERRRGVGGGVGERSLFEVLAANKAAKQAAFEEQNRLRNQFRALDEDEVEFLSGVREGVRAEEERVRRETEEGLAGFRKARMGGGDGDGDGGEVEVGESWGAEWTGGVGRKRKREKERLRGVKRRGSPGDGERGGDGGGENRSVETAGDDSLAEKAGDDDSKGSLLPLDTASAVSTAAPAQAVETEPTSKPKPTLGLVDYGSDDDDDDD